MKTFALIAIIALTIFAMVSQAQAAERLIPCGYDKNGDGEVKDIRDSNGNITLRESCGFCDLFGLGTNIINFFLFPGSTNNGFAIVPLIASFLFVVGGFTMLTAAGSPERTGRGKTILTTTVIGLIIVYASWIFVNTIFQAMGVAEWAGLGNWWQISCGVQ